MEDLIFITFTLQSFNKTINHINYVGIKSFSLPSVRKHKKLLVSKIIKHENYTEKDQSNFLFFMYDMALLKLKSPFNVSILHL